MSEIARAEARRLQVEGLSEDVRTFHEAVMNDSPASPRRFQALLLEELDTIRVSLSQPGPIVITLPSGVTDAELKRIGEKLGVQWKVQRRD